MLTVDNDNEDYAIGFWEINFIYLVVGGLAFFILLLDKFLAYVPCDCDVGTIGIVPYYGFFIFEGASTWPDPNEFGFLDIPKFFVIYSKLGTDSGCVFFYGCLETCWMGLLLFPKSNGWLENGL